MKHSYKIEGIVLGRRNFGEGDRVITILSKKRGKIILLAKGVRKISSRRGAKLDLFNLIRAQIFHGKTWDIIGEVESEKAFPRLKKSLKKVKIAYEISEIAGKFLPEEESNPLVFDLIKQNFTKLDGERRLNLNNLLYSFKVRLLVLAGFWPQNRQINSLVIDHYLENITQSKIKSKRIDV